MSTKQSDPTPEEIEQACREIQAGWTPAERHRRLRPDWRPEFRLTDGTYQEIDADDYETHIERHEELEDDFVT